MLVHVYQVDSEMPFHLIQECSSIIEFIGQLQIIIFSHVLQVLKITVSWRR